MVLKPMQLSMEDFQRTELVQFLSSRRIPREGALIRCYSRPIGVKKCNALQANPAGFEIDGWPVADDQQRNLDTRTEQPDGFSPN